MNEYLINNEQWAGAFINEQLITGCALWHCATHRQLFIVNCSQMNF